MSAIPADTIPGESDAGTGFALVRYEAAVLRNGFTMECARHQTTGPTTRLWLQSEGGENYMDVPSSQIEAFEPRQRMVPVAPPPAPASPQATVAPGAFPEKSPIQDLIAGAASRHRIDPDFVASVVRMESGFNPNIVSKKGAQGLMQLMPATAAMLGVENVLDPAANIEGGTKYLRQLLDKYAGDVKKALAAYNAGPGRVQLYDGVPPYPETQAYIGRVIADYNRKKLQQQKDATR